MKRWLAAAGLLLTAQAAPPEPPTTAPANAEAVRGVVNALQPDAVEILRRMAAMPPATAVENVAAYTPAETVRGGGGRAFPAARVDSRETAALDAGEAYAGERGSYAFLVLRDGRVLRERYWPGFDAASRYSTASMHKTVVALALGAAVAQGRIGLDDPAERWLPEWRGDPRGRITLRQLLQMRSGLETPTYSRSPDNPSVQLQFGRDIRAVALRTKLEGTPGAEFSYLNVNTQLAGSMLEAATGERYADFLSRTLWRPMGAADAAVWLDREGGQPHFACCLLASARDWARVGELIRLQGRANGRQVLPASWIAEMARPSPTNPNYGLQLWIGSPFAPARTYNKASPLVIKSAEPFAVPDVLFLDGAGGERVYISPSLRLTIVRIGKPVPDWDDTALPNLVFRAVQ